MKVPHIAALAVACALLAGCGAKQAAAVTVQVTHTVDHTVAATTVVKTSVKYVTEVPPTYPTQAAAITSSYPDGAYLIGSEIPPGNYTASGGTDSCVWLIFDSAHNPTASGFGRVASIPASGYDFESSGCGTWTAA